MEVGKLITYSYAFQLFLVTLALFSDSVSCSHTVVYIIIFYYLVSSGLFITIAWLWKRHYPKTIRISWFLGVVLPVLSFWFILSVVIIAIWPEYSSFLKESPAIASIIKNQLRSGGTCLVSLVIIITLIHPMIDCNLIFFREVCRERSNLRGLTRREFSSIALLQILTLTVSLFTHFDSYQVFLNFFN